MSQPSLIPVALLYTHGNRPVEGATRFQKLVFLAQQESSLPSTYDYYAHKFGPFSPELSSDLEVHIENGIIQRQTVYNEVGNKKHIYSLTPAGLQYAQQILTQTDIEPVFEQLQNIKSTYNNWSLERLIRHVYGKYSEYTTETELDLENLFDPEADSQFLEPGEEGDPQFSYLDEVDVESLQLSGSGEKFERAKLEAFYDQELRVEKFNQGRIAVYWPSNLDCGSFLAQVREDERISEESECEMRLVGESDWRRGTYENVLSEIDDSAQCQFIAIASDDYEYEVTWEKGLSNDDDNEITILLLPASNREMSSVRSVLTIYLIPELSAYNLEGDIDGFVMSNDNVREYIWETTRYLLA